MNPAGTSNVFEVHGLRVEIGGVVAVADLSLQLAPGEVLGLIGPNGAGKTTAVNAVTGYRKPTRGRALLDGRDVTGWPPERLARHGLGRTFQGARLFHRMTILENVLVAAQARLSRRAALVRAETALDELGLLHLRDSLAGGQPAGVQRKLGLARALALDPRYLLLDEPAAGLNDDESDGLSEELRTIRSRGNCGVLVIEHDMRLIMGICDRLVVLDSGSTIFTGTPADARLDDRVIEAYLGSSSTT